MVFDFLDFFDDDESPTGLKCRATSVARNWKTGLEGLDSRLGWGTKRGTDVRQTGKRKVEQHSRKMEKKKYLV